MADKVSIGYRTFSIEPFPVGFGDRLDGETDLERLTIHFHPASLPAVKSCTILHEIFHVLWADAALREGDAEERIITALANGFSQVIKDNPNVMAFIISGLRK